jgi:6-phospho-3-hexuloisomerase
MSNINSKIKLIIKEIENVLLISNYNNIDEIINTIANSKKIVTCGAGRVGYAIRSFCMRLGHCNFNATHIGDTTVPRIGTNDLFLVASGSGETKTIVEFTKIAKSSGAKIIAFTNNVESTIGKLSDLTVEIKAPNKIRNHEAKTIQPMTTLNEQSLWLFFDSLVLVMMEKLNIPEELMKNTHSILE